MLDIFFKSDKQIKRSVILVLDIILGIATIPALVIVILLLGFYLDSSQVSTLKYFINITIIIFIAQELFRLILSLQQEKPKRERRIKEQVLALLLLSNFFWRDTALGFLVSMIPEINIIDITFVYLGVTQITIIISYVISVLRNHNIARKIKIHPGAITAISFAAVIFIGGLLLYMPKSSPSDNPIKFIDALFTSTTAVCVTGLTTSNIGSDFTLTGKLIILCLIQIGGIGVMTLSSFLATILIGGISFRMTIMLQDILSEDYLSEVTSVLKKISIFTFSIELVGAIIIYCSIQNNIFEINYSNMFSAIFHSVSAFCNAGLSIYPANAMDPLIQQNYPFLGTLMALIFIGGIGFLPFSNLFSYILYKKNRQHHAVRRLNLTTKLIFVVSFIIVIGAGLLVFFTESYPAESWMTTGDRLMHSFFMIISSRTSGFASIYLDKVGNFTILIIMIVMWIGASPGSTGGGIKTTTVGVLFLHFVNYLRGQDNLHYSHRRIEPLTIQKSQMVVFATTIVTVVLLSALVLIEPKMSITQLAFEAISAVSTTGLSLGITPYLTTAAKSIIITLMYVGRVGVLTFLFAFFVQREKFVYEYPDERVIVG